MFSHCQRRAWGRGTGKIEISGAIWSLSASNNGTKPSLLTMLSLQYAGERNSPPSESHWGVRVRHLNTIIPCPWPFMMCFTFQHDSHTLGSGSKKGLERWRQRKGEGEKTVHYLLSRGLRPKEGASQALSPSLCLIWQQRAWNWVENAQLRYSTIAAFHGHCRISKDLYCLCPILLCQDVSRLTKMHNSWNLFR